MVVPSENVNDFVLESFGFNRDHLHQNGVDRVIKYLLCNWVLKRRKFNKVCNKIGVTLEV